jgi:two-component system nitrate/nitrite sensor histidine kinase NarX
MNFSSIQSRLTLLLLAFCLLVIISVGATFWSLENQKQDAATINLAGRQRMLVQLMTRSALEIGANEGDLHIQILQESIQTFETTLEALKNGGLAPYPPGDPIRLPATHNLRLLEQLGEIETTWEIYKNNLESLLNLPPDSPDYQAALEQVERLSPYLVQKSDLAVRLYEAFSNQKVTRLRWIQAVFLASALLLVAGGAWMVRYTVVGPLHHLGKIAWRIGSGDLDTPVEGHGLKEIQLLEENFDQMRLQLLESQAQAKAWTDLLEQRVKQRTQELEALYTVSREISSRLSIDDVLRSITQKTRALIGSDVVFLCLFNEPDQTMALLSSSGPEGAIVRRTSRVSTTMTGQVLAGERALRCDQGCRGYCEILASPYRTSHLAAPLKIERQIIGALCVGSEQPDQFGEETVEAVTQLANVAAVALQNARLYEQAERLAASEERQRIAAEMHDGLAQTLSYTKLAVNQGILQVESGQLEAAVDTLERVNSALNEAIEDTRRAIASLQDQGPLTESLQEQLVSLVREFSDESPVVHWSCKKDIPIRLSRQESQQVLRVAKEAVLNAVRHSGATCIKICIEQMDREYRVMIEDDGQGFDPEAAKNGDGRQHFGLNIMRARAARLAGRLELQTAPCAGTRVSLYWPVKSEAR